MQLRAKLRKYEILRLKNDIDQLFKEGEYVKVLPLKILYQVPSTNEVENEATNKSVMIQVMFIVSKRGLASAVRRNRIKRCLREAYRQLKSEILMALSQKCPSVRRLRLAFIFQSTQSESVSTKQISTKQMKAVVSKGMEKVIKRLSQKQAACKMGLENEGGLDED